MACYL
jgi:hypothetical protein